jgi:uncharacterized protein (TIGR02647 family)
MRYTPELLSELNILAQYNLREPTKGIKVHSTAAPELVAGAARLHEKGLTSQVDGGYLTPRGIEAARHAEVLLRVLTFDGP